MKKVRCNVLLSLTYSATHSIAIDWANHGQRWIAPLLLWLDHDHDELTHNKRPMMCLFSEQKQQNHNNKNNNKCRHRMSSNACLFLIECLIGKCFRIAHDGFASKWVYKSHAPASQFNEENSKKKKSVFKHGAFGGQNHSRYHLRLSWVINTFKEVFFVVRFYSWQSFNSIYPFYCRSNIGDIIIEIGQWQGVRRCSIYFMVLFSFSQAFSFLILIFPYHRSAIETNQLADITKGLSSTLEFLDKNSQHIALLLENGPTYKGIHWFKFTAQFECTNHHRDS